VKFTFDRMLDEEHPYYETGPFPLSFNFADVTETRVVDEYTVEFTLGQPFAPFLTNLATNTGGIVSPTAVAEYGDDFGRNPVGTGPFRFAEWQSNTRVVVERNPDYWGEPAGVEAVVFRPVTDANTRVAEMLSGGLDIMVEVPPDNVAMFADDPTFTVYDAVGPHVWYVMLNAKEGPFADLLVRQAANYAVNKETLVNDVLQGTADISAGPIPPAFGWAYNEAVEPYPYDPDMARQLLEESGVEDLSVTFYVTEGGSGMLDPVPMGTAIQADLEAVGFDVTIETYEWNTFLANVNPGLEGKADMAEMAWMTTDPDTLPFLTLRTAAWPDEGGFNSSYYSNIDVDEMLDQARMSTDLEERAALYRDIQQVVNAEAPWIFVANWKQNAVSTANVQGFELQPDFNLELAGVSKQ
jgi:peptide/nickel transport system substrate-binding protein